MYSRISLVVSVCIHLINLTCCRIIVYLGVCSSYLLVSSFGRTSSSLRCVHKSKVCVEKLAPPFPVTSTVTPPGSGHLIEGGSTLTNADETKYTGMRTKCFCWLTTFAPRPATRVRRDSIIDDCDFNTTTSAPRKLPPNRTIVPRPTLKSTPATLNGGLTAPVPNKCDHSELISIVSALFFLPEGLTLL